MLRNSIEPAMKRTAFARRIGTALNIACWCHATLATLAVAVAAIGAAAHEALPVSEVAPGVYVATGAHEEASADNLGAIANVGFVIGREAVAVIDTGGSARAGHRLLGAVRAVTDLPIRFVINTHVHPDHILGNAAFVGDAPRFVGHRNLPRAMAERGAHYLRRLHAELGPLAEGTQLVAPTVAVDDVMDIDLGGRTIRLTAFPAAHTDTDLTVFDVASGVMWTGDLLFVERVPVVDGSLKGWLATGSDLRGTAAALVVPGHGAPTTRIDDAFAAQDRYLRALLTEIRALIARGASMEQAVETVAESEHDRWLLFEAYHPRNVVTAYTELEWE